MLSKRSTKTAGTCLDTSLRGVPVDQQSDPDVSPRASDNGRATLPDSPATTLSHENLALHGAFRLADSS